MHIPPLELTRNRRQLHWNRFDAARIWHFLSSLRRRCPVRLFLLIVTLSAIYTFVILQYSFQKGRLAQEITYDDVDYFQDGLQRLNLLHEKGLIEFIKNYVRQPPHSPSATLLAAVGFLLFGVHDWAPYAMNCVLVVILLWFTWSLAGGMPRLPQFILAAFVLACPFTIMAVHEFRPDFTAALFTAMGCVKLLHSARLRIGVRFFAGVTPGIFFGLALLSKPSVFPFTLMMIGCSLVAAAAIAADYQWRNFSWKSFLPSAARVLLPCGLIPFPHYLVAHREITAYIFEVIFGKDAGVWHYAGNWKEQFTYFLTGYGGAMMLGKRIWLMLGFSVSMLLVIRLQKNENGRQLRFLLVLATLVLVAYLIPTLNRSKNPFFGLTFQILLFFFMISGWNLFFLGARNGHARFLGPAFTTLLLAYSLFGFRPSAAIRRSTSLASDPAYSRRMNASILHSITASLRPQNKTNSVYLCTVGLVNEGTLNWMALKEKLPLTFRQHELNSDLNYCRKEMEAANYILASEPGAYGQWEWHPSCRQAAETLRLAREEKNFTLIQQFEAPDRTRFFLYHNDILPRAASADFASQKKPFER